MSKFDREPPQQYFRRRGQKTLEDNNFSDTSDKLDRYEEQEKKDLKRVALPRRDSV
jgi:hypothetical protein